MPVFVVDARTTNPHSNLHSSANSFSVVPIRDAKQTAIGESLDNGRGFFDAKGGALVIEPATFDDAANYSCAVEFVKAPTQSSVARVQLVGKCIATRARQEA